MNDKTLLKICLIKIETRLSWGSSDSWSNKEYVQLSEMIANKTGITLSTSSLRRLFSKANSNYTPQLDTRNALAKFLEFEDWHEFRKHNEEPKKQKHQRKLYSYALFVAMVVIAILVVRNKMPEQKSNDSLTIDTTLIRFEGQKLIGTQIPHTVKIDYNIPQAYLPVIIDWNDVAEDAGKNPKITKIQKPKGTISHIYFDKDIYHIRLRKGKQTLKTLRALVKTEGWECYVKQNENHLQLPSEAFLTSEGDLNASKQYLQNKGIDFNKSYRLYYRNNTDFNVAPNNFTFKASFKPEFREGFVDCNHVQIELQGIKESVMFTLKNKGCEATSKLYITKGRLSGITNDLSAFTLSNHVWYNFEFRVINSVCRVYGNDSLLLERSFDKEVGVFKGVRFEFKGRGAVKNFEFRNID